MCWPPDTRQLSTCRQYTCHHASIHASQLFKGYNRSWYIGGILRKFGVGKHLPAGLHMGGDALTAHPRVDPATGNALFLFMLMLVLMQMIQKSTIAKTHELLPASSCSCCKLVLWAGCLAALGVAVVHAQPLCNLLCYATWKRQHHCAYAMMPCLSACIHLV